MLEVVDLVRFVIKKGIIKKLSKIIKKLRIDFFLKKIYNYIYLEGEEYG